MKRYPAVIQHSEEDCGAACLAAIARYYGKTLSLSRMRALIGTGQMGTTLLGLRRGAEKLGFKAQAVQASDQLIEKLDQAPLPAILHWQGRHWIVLYAKRGKRFIINDPTVGLRQLSLSELLEGWSTRIMLLVELEGDRFEAISEEKIQGLGQFWHQVQAYRGTLGQALLLNLVVGVLGLSLPMLLQVLTDTVLVQKDASLLTLVILGVLSLNLLSGLLEWLQSIFVAHFLVRVHLRTILRFAQQLLRLPLDYYEGRRSGEITNRLQDVQQISQLAAQAVLSVPNQFFMAVMSVVLMLIYSPPLTAIALGLIGIMLLPTGLFWKPIRNSAQEVLVYEAENQSLMVEIFRGATTVKTTLAEPQLWDIIQQRFGLYSRRVLRKANLVLMNQAATRTLGFLSTTTLLWIGSRDVLAGQLSAGQLLAFNSLSYYVISFANTLIYFIESWARTQAVALRVGEVLEAKPEGNGLVGRNWAAIPAAGAIACCDLTFYHPGRKELLQNFSLRIPGGKTVALIGPSGCGKSTLVKLLAGLYSAQSGNIRFGPYNQGDLSLDCLRQQVVLVPQDAYFWSRDIIENFRMSVPQASFEEIVGVCEMVGADEFISAMPFRYETVLGEFGANLSGGQRQRLAIARAILLDPPVLILDESTGALDPASETDVLDRLLRHRRGKTTIMISHRPRVVERADWIILLEKGQVALEGDPRELRSKAGDYLSFLVP